VKNKKKKPAFWSCKYCGRCYPLNGIELSTAGEKRMKDLERAWERSKHPSTLCCRETYDKWRITQKMNKK
jgi:hypothetical protein